MKKNKIGKSAITNSGAELTKLIKVIIAVLIFFIIFLTITYFITKKNNKDSNKTEISIQYHEILVGQILTRGETEYYVLVEKENDNYIGLYESYLAQYQTKTDSLKAYLVDLSVGFNVSYLKETSNLNIEKISDISFNNTTLLKIKDKKIVAYYETKENIINHLEGLI